MASGGNVSICIVGPPIMDSLSNQIATVDLGGCFLPPSECGCLLSPRPLRPLQVVERTDQEGGQVQQHRSQRDNVHITRHACPSSSEFVDNEQQTAAACGGGGSLSPQQPPSSKPSRLPVAHRGAAPREHTRMTCHIERGGTPRQHDHARRTYIVLARGGRHGVADIMGRQAQH